MDENQQEEEMVDEAKKQEDGTAVIKKSHFWKKNKNAEKQGWQYELFDLVRTLVICALVVFLFTRFIMSPVKVDGYSMYPTLDDKEIGVVNKIDVKWHGIQRFDVVVVNDPKITGGKEWVKRVIGLPGDTIYAKNDVVYVNGKPIKEPYLNTNYVNDIRAQGDQFTSDFGKVKLGPNQYWLMGDNRVVSHDSRAVGPFKGSDFVGKDIYIFYPFNKMRLVRNGAR